MPGLGKVIKKSCYNCNAMENRKIFHISDCKKYKRCPRLYCLDRDDTEETTFRPFIRIDEEVTELAAKKLGIKSCFKGAKGDDPALAMAAMKDHEWLVKARFEYDRLRVKVPFLHRTKKGWNLYFLYNGLYPRVDDMQFYCDMVWVLEGCGVVLDKIYIIHLNADYVRGDALDPDQLFLVGDHLYNGKNNPTYPLRETIYKRMLDLRPLMDEMEKCHLEDLPAPKRTSKCTGRMKCRHYDTCFKKEAEGPVNSILTLIASSEKYAMKAEGIEFLRDADFARVEGSRQQYAQIMADKLGGLYVDQYGLNAWLDRIQYPISFLDFEWERFAIPPYKGMKPYDVLPFEYSLHVMQEDGTVEHHVFLSIHDDRRDMADSLVRHIPKEGSVVAYNADCAERVRIAELAEQFPEYRQDLLHMNERMEDLELPFVAGTVYDVRMVGQWSLKKIMSLMNDESYSDLDINQGMDAVFEWRHLDHGDDVENEKEIVENLKKYCSMDSYAMTVVYKWLLKIAGRN